jgi:transposase InsO family protein
VPEATSGTIADFLQDKIFVDYGPPREIITDNGKQFTSDVVAHLMQKVRARHHLITPYHPRSNGKIERYNGALGKILTRMLVGQPVAL